MTIAASDAMDACLDAWNAYRRSRGITFELDETTDTSRRLPSPVGGLVEPERLTTGAEPCCDTSGRTDGSPVAAPAATSTGSAPPHTHRPREV